MGKGCIVIGAAMLDIVMEIDRIPKSGTDVYAKGQSMMVGGCAYNVADILKHFGVNYTLFAPIGTGMYADFIRKDHRDGQTGPGLPGGVTVHGALVSSAGGSEHILAAAIPHLQSGIHAAGNVGTLPVDIDEHNEFHRVVAHLA